ncbi:MAG TPA: cation-transporting P-type ATPase [Oscillospiraceae bacterium]|nr:cation-transporting P-type ATPase [Oscillospiraceae bacterium]HPS34061.1 cation-transporting P-type ATPase [Oscillospiraceae bacterium]
METLNVNGKEGSSGPTKEIAELLVNEVYSAMETGPSGLSKAEAENRLKKYGANTIREVKGKPLIVRFLSNFVHLMAILLWVGGIVGFIAKMPELGIAIWMVNIINGVFSFMQEFRAEKATAVLKKMLPSYAHVIRDGEEQRILAEDLVPGDLILLAEGDKISADARLIDESDLKADQSTLTGESHSVSKTREAVFRKDISHLEMPNIVFAGTNVASGTGKAVVFSTAMNTEFGKIANLTQSQKEEISPLQAELAKVTKQVSFMAVSIGVFFFIASIFLAKANLAESFIFGMGMIVAFIPEGLLPTVTLSLAMGVQRMAKKNALVKRLSAVETLGCTTVICTDKTGTLTQNEMTVNDIWTVDRQYKVTGVGYAPEGKILDSEMKPLQKDDNGLRQLLICAGLCNNSRLVPPENSSGRWTVLGDPTEACLLVAAQKGGINLSDELRRTPRLRELPFESNRKRMSTIHQSDSAEKAAYIKGAPKEVLELCTRLSSNGQEKPMDNAMRERIMEANDRYARNGLRVLAVAIRKINAETGLPAGLSAYTPELVEQDMVFLGLIAMMDPPRPEVSEAVEKCRHAGIRIIMITGDYGLTAESIARRIGIVKGDKVRILTGIELEKISDDELQKDLQDEIIFARVAPDQKLRVVSALQRMGNVVAVTGDGVNDSPALKKADIGVAMGITGTDVAKEAADMILTDDNFASIVSAIEEGRAVYNNIRKFAIYILNSNTPEAVPCIFYLFSGGAIPLPLTVMQVLAIDLGTDMVPAIALGTELPEEGIMNRPPRKKTEHLLNKKVFLRAFLWYGMLESAAAMLAFFYQNWLHGWPASPMATSGTPYMLATTMTLAAIVFCQIGVVFNCRTDLASVFKVGIFKNRMVLVGIGVELTLLAALSYVPFLHNLFNTAPLGLRDFAFLIVLPPLMLFLEELRKAVLRKKERRITASYKNIN